jgi:drug/metabolite transporter (DMT)-like permease
VSVPAAFIGVVLIWSTTPLAIKWSGDGPGFLFGVASRMLIGLFVCLVLIALLSRRMRWHRDAMLTYLAGGLGLWGAMTSVYWGAQYIPSGLVSVLYGISPVVTAVMAALWLQEQALTPARLLGMALGLAGLVLIFGQESHQGLHTAWGMAAVLLSVHIHAASAVWIKRIGAALHPLETVTGSLLLAVPLFALNWLLGDGKLPSEIPVHALGSIVYLGVVGSVLGFVAYYYILHHVQASRVALITLITPVLALWLGQWANGEIIDQREWLGTAIILAGLAVFQWGGFLHRPMSRL